MLYTKLESTIYPSFFDSLLGSLSFSLSLLFGCWKRRNKKLDFWVAAIDHDALRWSGTADCVSGEQQRASLLERTLKRGDERQRGVLARSFELVMSNSRSMCWPNLLSALPYPWWTRSWQGARCSPLNASFSTAHFRLLDRVVHQGVALLLWCPCVLVPVFCPLNVARSFRGIVPQGPLYPFYRGFVYEYYHASLIISGSYS